jgi:hypothetical protein
MLKRFKRYFHGSRFPRSMVGHNLVTEIKRGNKAVLAGLLTGFQEP